MAPSERECIIEALRTIAPNHPTGRIWGRLESATSEQAQEGNAWAAACEDIADLITDALARMRRG